MRKLPENIEFLLNDLAQPQLSAKPIEHTSDAGGEPTFGDNIGLDELYTNREQANGVASDASDDK